MAHEEYPTKSGYLNFDPGGMYTINCRTLYEDSESNKDYRVKKNKVIEVILETPQYTRLDNFQVKFPSSCQPMRQVTSQVNRKEGAQLKCQKN